jgi:hypothetical protein
MNKQGGATPFEELFNNAVRMIQTLLNNSNNTTIKILRNILIQSSNWLFSKLLTGRTAAAGRSTGLRSDCLAAGPPGASSQRPSAWSVVAGQIGPKPRTLASMSDRTFGDGHEVPAGPRASLCLPLDSRPLLESDPGARSPASRSGGPSILVSMTACVALQAVRVPWLGLTGRPRSRGTGRDRTD